MAQKDLTFLCHYNAVPCPITGKLSVNIRLDTTSLKLFLSILFYFIKSNNIISYLYRSPKGGVSVL